MEIIHKFGIIDVETTGLDADNDQIIDFAILVVEYADDGTSKLIRETGRYNGLRDPGFPIPKEASRINGIKDRDVKGKELDYANIEILIDQCEFFIAHNASFDKKFVTKLIPKTKKVRWLCSMKDIDWYGYGHKSRSLESLAKHYRTKVQPDHSGIADAATVACLLMIQYDGVPLIEEIIKKRMSARKVTQSIDLDSKIEVAATSSIQRLPIGHRASKSKSAMYILWFFTGIIGGHRYYLRDYWYAFFMTITLGLYGIWTLLDLFFIGKRFKKKFKT